MNAPTKVSKGAIGFGGAAIHPLKSVLNDGFRRDVVFFGVNHEIARSIGTENPGAAVFIREKSARMAPWTVAQNLRCHDIGVLCSTPEVAIEEIITISASLARAKKRPLLIACDHSASYFNAIGSASAGALTYLYFDAHFDLGLHGGPSGLHNGNFVSALTRASRIRKAINIGGRSWSTFDPAYNRKISRFSCVRGTKAGDLIEGLSFLKGKDVYVSIDADVLDPVFAPNVSCPEPFGMSPSDLLAVCSWIGEHCTVVGGDLCELIPQDNPAQAEQVLIRSILALFSGS